MDSHTSKVEKQFGSVAEEYLQSTVHRQGADLALIADKLRGASDAAVLDLGCGAGHLSFAIAPQVRSVTAYDLSADMLEVVREEAARRGLSQIATRQGRVEELPFADESFDWVCTRYSAHHWTGIRGAIAEARRVLKPGGTLIVVDVCSPQNPLLDTHLQAVELLRDGSHVRNYTWPEWKSMLTEQGFQVRAPHFWKLPLDFAAWVGRMKTPPLHVEALQSLLRNVPQEVRDHFRIAEDGSFTLDCVLVEAS